MFYHYALAELHEIAEEFNLQYPNAVRNNTKTRLTYAVPFDESQTPTLLHKYIRCITISTDKVVK
jgi:hypothetical protein